MTRRHRHFERFAYFSSKVNGRGATRLSGLTFLEGNLGCLRVARLPSTTTTDAVSILPCVAAVIRRSGTNYSYRSYDVQAPWLYCQRHLRAGAKAARG